ncbi:MAG: hypothetical protein WCT42_02275 [Candidatus Paceibacterota bacterium]
MKKIIKNIFIVIGIIVLFLYLLIFFIAESINKSSRIESENYKKNMDLIQNRDKYLESDNNLFKEPQLIVDVGLTKYNDFYLITDKNYVILPYGRQLIDSRGNYYSRMLMTNQIRLSNLKKLLNKEIKIKVRATKNLPYGYKINENNLTDVYPLNQSTYYMADIIFDNYYLDMNFNPCNENYSTIDGYYCKQDEQTIYPRQKEWEGEKN